jgi:hypothetical protein
MFESAASRPAVTTISRWDALAHVYEDTQCIIGWGCFLEGSVTKGWLGLEDAYYKMMGCRKKASLWARGLMKQLCWKVAFHLWLHQNSWQHNDDNPQN